MTEWIEAHPVMVGLVFGLAATLGGGAVAMRLLVQKLNLRQETITESFGAMQQSDQVFMRGVEQKIETHADESRHQLSEMRRLMQDLDRIVTKHEEKIRSTREIVDGHDTLAERYIRLEGTVATKAELAELRGVIDTKFTAILSTLGEIRGEMRAARSGAGGGRS